MLAVYYLHSHIENGVDSPLGVDTIHDAILTTEDHLWKLLMDTTPDEDSILATLAVSSRPPTPEETALWQATEWPSPVPPIEFQPINPVMGVEHRLSHVEEFLTALYPP